MGFDYVGITSLSENYGNGNRRVDATPWYIAIKLAKYMLIIKYLNITSIKCLLCVM